MPEQFYTLQTAFPGGWLKNTRTPYLSVSKSRGYHPMMRIQYTCFQKCPINLLLYWKYSLLLLKLFSTDRGIISWAALIKEEDVPKVMLVWNWNHILNSLWGMESKCRVKWNNIWNFSVGLGRGCAVHLKRFSKKCRHVLCEICGWGRRAFEDEDKIP